MNEARAKLWRWRFAALSSLPGGDTRKWRHCQSSDRPAERNLHKPRTKTASQSGKARLHCETHAYVDVHFNAVPEVPRTRGLQYSRDLIKAEHGKLSSPSLVRSVFSSSAGRNSRGFHPVVFRPSQGLLRHPVRVGRRQGQHQLRPARGHPHGARPHRAQGVHQRVRQRLPRGEDHPAHVTVRLAPPCAVIGFERRTARQPVGGFDEKNNLQYDVDCAELTHTVIVLIRHPLPLQLHTWFPFLLRVMLKNYQKPFAAVLLPPFCPENIIYL